MVYSHLVVAFILYMVACIDATYLPETIHYIDMVASKQSTMTDRRALLTDREREIVAGEADVSDSYRYQTISRVRARLDRLAGDIDALEAHGELADELREQVCGRSDRDADTQPATDRRESGETGSKEQADESDVPSATTDTTPENDATPADDLAGVVDRVADGWDNADARIDARKEAALAVLEYAREHGTVSQKEAKENVEPNHPVDGQNPRTWYRSNVKPVLKEADFTEYDNGIRAYRLVDDPE